MKQYKTERIHAAGLTWSSTRKGKNSINMFH